MFIPHAFTTPNESDFERIVCLVISFLDTHEYLTQKMLRGENKTQENAVIIREFLKIDCKIIREMGENLEFGQELKKIVQKKIENYATKAKIENWQVLMIFFK